MSDYGTPQAIVSPSAPRCVTLSEGPLKVLVWLDNPDSTYLSIGEPLGSGMVKPSEVAALVARAEKFDRLARALDKEENP